MLNRDPTHGFSFQSVVDAIGGIGDDHEELFDGGKAIALHAQGGAVDGFPQQRTQIARNDQVLNAGAFHPGFDHEFPNQTLAGCKQVGG